MFHPCLERIFCGFAAVGRSFPGSGAHGALWLCPWLEGSLRGSGSGDLRGKKSAGRISQGPGLPGGRVRAPPRDVGTNRHRCQQLQGTECSLTPVPGLFPSPLDCWGSLSVGFVPRAANSCPKGPSIPAPPGLFPPRLGQPHPARKAAPALCSLRFPQSEADSCSSLSTPQPVLPRKRELAAPGIPQKGRGRSREAVAGPVSCGTIQVCCSFPVFPSKTQLVPPQLHLLGCCLTHSGLHTKSCHIPRRDPSPCGSLRAQGGDLWPRECRIFSWLSRMCDPIQGWPQGPRLTHFQISPSSDPC